MTVEEYRQALSGLSSEHFRKFRESWGGAQDTVEACVEAFAYSTDHIQWERTIIFRLRQFGVTNLQTEAEKVVAAALASAAAAKASAGAADRSATSAGESVRWSRRSVVVAVIAIAVSLIAIVVSVAVALLTR